VIDASSEVVKLVIPFVETPRPPLVNLVAAGRDAKFNEDTPIKLTEWASIRADSDSGRSSETLSLQVAFGDNALGLRLFRTDPSAPNDRTKYVEVTGKQPILASDLLVDGVVRWDRLVFLADENAIGKAPSIVLTVTDSAANGSKAQSVVSGSLLLAPQADGVADMDALASSLSQGVEVTLGDLVVLKSADGKQGILKGIDLEDPRETYSVRIGFVPTGGQALSSADAVIQVGDTKIPGFKSEADGGIYFALTQAMLEGGQKISLKPNTTNFGAVTSGLVEVTSIDGNSTKTDRGTFTVKIVTDPLAPQLAGNDLIVSERVAELEAGSPSASGFSFPIDIPINATRTSFEKVGLRISADDIDVTRGYFLVADTHGKFVTPINFVEGKWLLYNGLDSQLDFSTLRFVAPPNFYGDVSFSVTPFAAIKSKEIEDGAPVTVAVQITASAEQLTQATAAPKALQIAEVGSTLVLDGNEKAHLDILKFIDQGKLAGVVSANGKDSQEILFFDIVLPDRLFLYQHASGKAVLLQPLSSSSAKGETTYRIADSLKAAESSANFKNLYVGSKSYESGSGDITIKVSTLEPLSGDELVSFKTSLSYNVAPVANGASAVTLLKSAAQVSESSASVVNGVKLSTVIDLASDASYDPSETLSVFISTDTLSNLTLYTLAANGSVSGHGGATAVIGGKTGWLVDAASLPALYIRGTDYFSSANAQRIEFRSVSKEGGQAELSPDLSAPVSFSLTIKPVADGVKAGSLAVDANKTTKEYTAPLASNDYTVALNTLVTAGASKTDTTEELFYTIKLPNGQLSLVSLNGTTALPRASVDALNNIVYEVPEAQLNLFGIRGALYRSSNDLPDSPSFKVGVAAFTKEANGLASPVSPEDFKTVDLTVSAQPGQVFYSVPGSVAGPDSGAGVAFGVRAYTLDPSESMSVSIAFKSPVGKIALAKDDLSFFIGERRVVSGENGFTVVFDDATKTSTLQVTAEARDALKDLRVSSAKDFRLDDRLNVETHFTVSDGSSRDVTDVSSRLGFYKALPEVALQFGSPEVKGSGAAAVGFELTRPGLLPTGIALSDVTILISDVPAGAYFVVKDGNSSSPVGASFDEIPGLWVLSGADLFRNGSWLDADKLVLNVVGLDVKGSMSATVVVVDPLGGTSTTQTSPSVVSKINLTGEGDPLIFSWDGADINSVAVANDLIGLDFDKDGTLEFARYWLPAQKSSDVEHSFLVRPSAVQGRAIEMSDLYQTFNELVQDLGLDSPDFIAADQWGNTKLWTDLDADGVIDTGELQVMPEAFKLTLPAQQVRQDTGGGFQTLFKADVSYGGSGAESSGKLFAVGIPYLEPIPAGEDLQGAFLKAPAVTVSFVSQAAAAAVIPEDAAGGPAFMVGLRKSELGVGTTGGTHMVALQVSVKDEGGATIVKDWALSAGALKDAFWILTESSLDSPLRVVGLPENFTGSVEVTAKAYATATALGMPVSMVSEPYPTQKLTIEGLADAPLLLSASGAVAWTPSEGGTLYLTKDGTAQGQPVLSVISPDASENLSVQFTLTGTDVADVAVSGASEIIKGAGIYQVAASDLSGVKLTLADNQKTDFSVTFSAMSQQGNTSAQSSDSLTFNASVQPDADNLSAATTTFSLSAESVNEGGEPIQVSLTAKPADASEIVKHKVLVGSSDTGFQRDSILSLSGYSEIAVTDAEAGFWSGVLVVDAANFKSREWKLFEIEGLVDSAGGFTRRGDLFLDAFYDGSLTIAQSAYTVEQQNGDESDPQTRIRTLTVNPVVEEAMTQVYFANSKGDALQTIALTEGDVLGTTLRLYARSSDPDEQVTLPDAKDLILPEGMTASFVSAEAGYREYQIFAASNESIDVDKPIAVSAKVIFSDGVVSAPITQQINIELTKISTTPTFADSEPGGLKFQVVDGQRNSIHGDPVSTQGVYFELPTIDEESRSDDALSYRLEDIPKWMTLVAPAGSLLASSDSLYSLEFEEQELATLRWKFDRDFLVSKDAPDASATLTWLAVHTEPSNFKNAISAPVQITIERSPYPTEPVILGPKTIEGVEGEKIALSNFDVNLGAFEDLLTPSEKEECVTVTVSTQGRTLTKISEEGQPYELAVGDLVAGSSGEINIPYSALSAAMVRLADSDFSGKLDLTLAARFTLGGHIRHSKNEFDVEVSISNLPEPLKPSVFTLPESIPEDASVFGPDGRKGILIKLVGDETLDPDTREPSVFSLKYDLGAEVDEGEQVSAMLTLDNKAELWLIGNPGVPGQMISPISSDNISQTRTYDVTNAVWDVPDRSLENYQIFSPLGTGNFTGTITARTVDLETGATSEPKETSFSVVATLVLDKPELELYGAATSEDATRPTVSHLEISEGYESFFEVLSFSPDAMEHAKVTLKLSEALVSAGGSLSLKASGADADDLPYVLTYDAVTATYALEWTDAGKSGSDYIPNFEDRAQLKISVAENYYTEGWGGDDLPLYEDFNALTTEISIVSSSFFDPAKKGDVNAGSPPLNSQILKISVSGENDTPEFVKGSIVGDGGTKVVVSAPVIEFIDDKLVADSINLEYYFVDPDVFQKSGDYEVQWGSGSGFFGPESDVASRALSDMAEKLSDVTLAIEHVGTYKSGAIGEQENIFEISASLPQANQLVTYKTASEVIDLNLDLVLTDKDADTKTKLKLQLESKEVILPNFDLLLRAAVEEEVRDAFKEEAAAAYREAIFYGGQNDFSEFEATEEEITQIAPEYEKLVSTFVTPAGEPRLDGQMIEVTENPQGEILSSNIYGTSGRDIILGAGEGGSLLYGGDGVSHDMIIGSKGNDLILLGGGIDYVAGSQVPGFVGDEDIYVVSSLIDYAEMETVGMTDVLAIYFAGKAQAMANAIQAHVSSLGVDKAYMVGIIEDLAITAVDDAWEAIDRVYFDGFSADRSQADAYFLDSGETLLTQVFSTGTAGESNAKAYSLLLSRSDFTLQEHYDDTIFFS
jgi:hypothetical protein